MFHALVEGPRINSTYKSGRVIPKPSSDIRKSNSIDSIVAGSKLTVV